MHCSQQTSSQQVILECPSCGQSFAYDSRDLKAGNAILCGHCRIHFICRSRDLFTALKHIGLLAG